MSQAVIERLLNHPKFGQGVGFHRMQHLLQDLWQSDWGRQFTTIRVTGSNGKGSVTALIHSMVRQWEPHCGRFTSPHLLRFHERIVVGDREVTDAELARADDWLQRRLRETGRDANEFGSFELITALGICCFAQTDMAVAVVEAGIGGRYDPTRLCPGNRIALTSIDLEHADLLGPTHELIAYDKLDLCPDGGLVAAVPRDPSLWERMESYCRLRQITLVNAAQTCEVIPDAISTDGPGMIVRIREREGETRARLPLLGTFQYDNLAIAWTLASDWARRHRPDGRRDDMTSQLVRGLEQVEWPGRFEQISADPRVIVDVGHTPDACARVVESVQTFLQGERVLLVTGVSYNKSVAQILEVLVPLANCVICTRAYHKGEKVERIAEVVRSLAPSVEQFSAATIEEAAELARRLARERGCTALVAGGLFLAIEFRTAWSGGNPQAIRFY